MTNLHKNLNRAIACLLFLSMLGCRERNKYEGDWIVIFVIFNNVDITESVGLRNLTIDFRNSGTTPIVRYGDFDQYTIDYENKFKYYKHNKAEYINIKGSKYFTDTFLVRCLDENCCHISLENESKYIELIFNGELSFFEKRRNCPYILDILEDIDKVRTDRKSN